MKSEKHKDLAQDMLNRLFHGMPGQVIIALACPECPRSLPILVEVNSDGNAAIISLCGLFGRVEWGRGKPEHIGLLIDALSNDSEAVLELLTSKIC